MARQDELTVRVLGPLEVLTAGAPVGPAGVKRRGLLALLALRANAVVPASELVQGLWGDRAPASAGGLVQTYVSTWRKALPGGGSVSGPRRLATVPGGYRLHLSLDESDLLRFTSLAERGHRALGTGDLTVGRRLSQEALSLWRGPPLPELASLPFHADAVRPVQDRRVQAVEDWAECVLRTAPATDLGAVVSALEDVRATDPWRERPPELLMWALFRQGRQREALDLHTRIRLELATELGSDPGPSLRRMHERVLRQDPALHPAATVLLPATAARLDSFVGREGVVASVHALLGSCRLVTLTGPGGSGKTRLAEEVAAAAERNGDGEVVVVELAPLEDAALVPATIASRLGLTGSEPLPALVGLLADRSLLLVLDNLEHLPGVDATIRALLRGSRHLRILATAREPLRVAGEQRFPVPPLDVPAPGDSDVQRLAASASVRLLVDRAHAVDPTFRVDAANVMALAEVVRRLDGLPLAIEIVAPWLQALTPAGLLAHLDHPLDLPGRRSDAERRHETLRDAITWSHHRLPAEARDLLARVSVFRGAADLDAITAIAARAPGETVLPLLADLVDRNLVQAAPPVAGRPRFRLLATIREFCAEQLAQSGDAAATQARAADWYAQWAVGLAAHSEGPDTPRWLAQAVAQADDLRAAIDYLARAGRVEEHLQLVVDTMVLWFEAGHEREGERRLEAALTAAPPEASARPIGLVYLAWLCATHDRARAVACATEAEDLARRRGDRPVRAFALQTLGDTLDDHAAALAAATEAGRSAAEVSREGDPIRYGPTAGDAVACGAAHTVASLLATRSLPAAIEQQERALLLAQHEGDRRITAVNAARLGQLHLLAGNVPAARAPIQRAGVLLDEPVTARWEDIVAFALSCLAQHDGLVDEAERRLRSLVTAALAGGRMLHVNLGSCALTDLLVDAGRLEAADTALRVAETAVGPHADPRHRAPLLVRRARLLRLDGRRSVAVTVLEEARAGVEGPALGPERIVHLVESAVLAADETQASTLVTMLRQLSELTGVAVPPWEQRLLASVLS